MLTLVTTWYRATETLPEFYRRASAAAAALGEYELLWVFDGTSAQAAQPYRADPRVRVLQLPERRGEGAARLAGLREACGETIFLLPGDLEIAPETLPRFLAELNKDTDVVIGCQLRRRGGLAERWSGAVFYRLYNRVARQPIPPNPAGCYLFRASAARQVRENVLFVAGVLGAGLRARIVLVDKTRRQPSGYRWRDRCRLAWRALRSA